MFWLIAVTLVLAQDWFGADMDSARTALRQSRYAEAQQQRDAALKETVAFPPNDARTAQVFEALVELNVIQGYYVQAEQFGKQSLAIREAVLGAESEQLVPYLLHLAAVKRAAGKRNWPSRSSCAPLQFTRRL